MEVGGGRVAGFWLGAGLCAVSRCREVARVGAGGGESVCVGGSCSGGGQLRDCQACTAPMRAVSLGRGGGG